MQFKLADMATAIEAARLTVFESCMGKRSRTRLYTVAASMAKVYASETAQWVTTEAVQIHGGYGYCKRIPLRKTDAGCQDHTDMKAQVKYRR